MKYTIPCLFGLEALVADELRRLDLKNVRAENGRVHCDGGPADIPRLNINLRCGARVLVELASFPAPDFEALFQGVAAIPWEDCIPRDGEFPVKGYSISSQLHSVPACQAIVKKAAAKRLGQAYGCETLPETGDRYQIQFALIKDTAAVYLDTSGDGLYKRGYRAHNNGAPLRETLAAALVLLSRYRGRDPFCDPFCGSGTICIEAALIALNRAPGLDRSFDAQRWGFVPSGDWLTAAGEAMDKEFHGRYDIWGGDVDPRAVAIARDNARKAGVEDVVRFEVADMRNFRRDDTYGQLVTNPPYGERLLERQEAEALYRDFGKMWERLPDTWRTLVLSSHTEFERTFGHQAKKKRKLYNGMIKCDLFMYGNV
ncbi:class I SAM-dependent RNA methyltransferase [Dysosmobacter sp.]|uniref:THUMP domain-containing class I SAM-dependent RNA methyltransferase n=1 Tax=Dysosmobacter sp. TaxID=2591382 RepID=UPI002840A25D|nr:class I SAM-dependent RNA methyltransferase [Dysosmobacter sp.]MDR3949450.1 class I SAM-dependent RNA methyltransferase [Dysosmobacter sp.]